MLHRPTCKVAAPATAPAADSGKPEGPEESGAGSSGNFCSSCPSSRMQQYSLGLVRAHRHINELLESLEEDILGRESDKAAEFLRLKQEIRQKISNLRCATSAIDGDRKLVMPTPVRLKFRQPAVTSSVLAGDGDDRLCRQPPQTPLGNLTATETSAEELHHQPCPCSRYPPPRPPAAGTSSGAVTDSIITSLDDGADSVGVKVLEDVVEDDEEKVTCTGTVTDTCSDQSEKSARRRCARSRTAIAIEVQKKPSAPPGQATTKSVPAPTSDSAMTLRMALRRASEPVAQPPQPPQFHLAAATWAAAVGPVRTLQQKQQQAISSRSSDLQQPQKKLQMQQLPQMKPQQQKPQPQPLQQPACCPSRPHSRPVAGDTAVNTTSTATASSTPTESPSSEGNGTSISTSSGSGSGSTRLALVMPTGAADKVTRPSQPLPSPPVSQSHQRKPGQHRCSRRNRQGDAVVASTCYLPCDSFSATEPKKCQGPSTEQQQPPPQLQHAHHPKRRHPRSSSVCRRLLAAVPVFFWLDAQSPTESVDRCCDIQTIASFIVSSSKAATVHVCVLSRPSAPTRASLALVVIPPVRHGVTPLTPWRPVLRQLRQRATVCVQQPPTHEEPQLPPMLLRHFRTGCCLLERLSITARLCAGFGDSEPGDQSSVALMSRLYCPEDLGLVAALPEADDSVGGDLSDDSCSSSSEGSSENRQELMTRRRRSKPKEAACTIVGALATYLACSNNAATMARARAFQQSGYSSSFSSSSSTSDDDSEYAEKDEDDECEDCREMAEHMFEISAGDDGFTSSEF